MAAREPLADRALLERARAGDEEAFAELVRTHTNRVYALLRRFGLDAREAEEVAQEVFLRAWRGLPGFQARAKFSTWLYRIAFNEAQRRLSRRPAPAVSGPEHDDVLSSLPADPRLGPEALVLDREFETVLQRALAELPDDLRAAVILRDLEGLSTEESAGVTGVREAAFKSRLHRGRMQLRTLLEPYLQFEQG
jgi:RNA polymerase sigma-70 factor, ECF subfamily